jgi:hypothetical protein
MRGPTGGTEALGVAILTAALSLADLARADTPNVRLKGLAGMAVRLAVEGAARRLERPGCQRVFSDFRDGAGRPLQAVLDQLGETPAGYLRDLVFFYDGASQARCGAGGILAGTQRGSRVIYVCPLQFSEAFQRDTFLAEVIVIHETLHSLGLGENPPASMEITRRVMRQCAERAALDR